MAEYILELKNISKHFPGVKALDGVNFKLEKGEIHALMGENGAGKSTFIKVITGVHSQTEGQIILNGQEVSFKNPKEASKLSIAAIYQHGTSYPHLTVAENIFMGHEIVNPVLKTLKWGEMNKRAKELLKSIGSDVDPRVIMSSLTVAEQQVVEIAKAISTNAKIIIMDEPTAALSKRECENLYTITEKLRDEGVSIIFISHRFEDMYRLASKVTVFRDGKYIGTWGVDEISNHDLITAMVGREITDVYPKAEPSIKDVALEVININKKGYFKDISFTLRKGEILGFTGLVGAGRSEVVEAIYGATKLDSGKIVVDGKEEHIKNPLSALNVGIGLIPEDRQRQGLFLDWDICDNITISNLDKYTHKTIVNTKEERLQAKKIAESIATKATSVFDKVYSLSGGNQQKVVISKILCSNLKVLIMDEPTKGVDVGAKSQIYQIMSDLAQKGYGIIMISSDMPEVLGMSDRIIVMHEGKITGEFDGKTATQEKLLEAAMNLSNSKTI